MLTKQIATEETIVLNTQQAAQFVKTANQFSADIYLERNGHRVNGRSLMGLLELANRQGREILLLAEGEDAPQALSTLGQLLEQDLAVH